MIADFIIDRMSGYISGGIKPETAARSTMGELSAIYRGRHYSRDTAGVMRPTPPPENISLEEAGAKCKAAINEILNYGKENTGKGPPLNAEKKSGLEGLKRYVRRKIA